RAHLPDRGDSGDQGNDPPAAPRAGRRASLMKLPLPRRAVVPGVLASFEHIDAATDAIRSLRSSGHRDLTVYTASPNHEVEDAMGHTNSPVRLFTLVGGLTGCAAGFAMTIWMARDWPVLT